MAEAPKKTRAKQVSRPIMLVFQILDADGNPTPFEKSRIKVLAATRDAAVALDKMEGAEHATYVRAPIEG